MRQARSDSSIARGTPDAAGRLEEGDYFYDPVAGEAAVQFIERYFVHVKGEWAGQPFRLSEKQKDDIVRPLFGWKHKVTGYRRYRKASIWMPRKNGKSALAAPIGTLLFVGDGEPGAEVVTAANDKTQAEIVFGNACSMVQASEDLSAVIEVYKTAMVCMELGSSFKPLSSDARTKHGMNTHGAIIDELHEFRSRELLDTIETGMGARRQPMIVTISTAGVYDKTTPAWQEYDYACKVRDGLIDDPELLVVIYEAARDDDWTDEAVWKKANPNYGVSVKPDFLRRECEKAKRAPWLENRFKRLYLNMWTEAETRWISLAEWERNEGAVAWRDLPDSLDPARPFYGALDLASRNDTASWTKVFPPLAGGHGSPDDPWVVVPQFFIPGARIMARVDRDRVPYDQWRDMGALVATDGDIIDQNFIKAAVLDDCARWQCRKLGYDRYDATKLVLELADEGLPVEGFGQGYVSLSPPSKSLGEELVPGARLVHGGHPVLAWQIGNVMVKMDPAGNIKPDKAKSIERIDGVVATIMALGLALTDDEDDTPVRVAWID